MVNPPSVMFEAAPAEHRNDRFRRVIILFSLAISAGLLFTRLGHYALWDDEANTALIGEGVWQTGDTSAVVGKNIVAYHGGAELSHLKDRYLPPLQFFVVAPFVGIWPGSSWAARFPFAICGLLAVMILFLWLAREKANRITLLLTSIALVGNVSFWLYLRQCRYYSLSILFSLAIAYLYHSPTRKKWTVPLIAFCSVGLFASNYLNFAALYGALGVDWLIWSRQRWRLSIRDFIWLVLPQLLVSGCIFFIWNPVDKKIFGGNGTALTDRIRLFWWAWRDINRCEFAALPLLVAAPLVALWKRNSLLLRASIALFIYVTVVVILTPQNPGLRMDPILQPIRIFDVRYLAPAIPLMIAVSVLTIARLLPQRSDWPALLIGLIAFGTNGLNGGCLVGNDAMNKPAPLAHSAPLLFIRELIQPGSDPYTLASDWIKANLSPGESIWILPDYMVFPLIFHAPQAVYAWQLPNHTSADLQGLNPVFYYGRILPDYLICFGPNLRLSRIPGFQASLQHRQVATINFYWHDLYRPELAWRSFAPVTEFDAKSDSIRIYRLTPTR